MNTILMFCFILFLVFLVMFGHRYLQMVWWNVTLFGWRSTFKDLSGLTRTYMAIGNVFLTSNTFFNEFELDLHRAGIGISCKKGTGLTHLLHANQPLNEYSRQFLVDISKLIRGDSLWVSLGDNVTHQDGMEIMRISGIDIDRYGITPITLAYYHLTKDSIKQTTNIQRAHYGSSRIHQHRNLPSHYSSDHLLGDLPLSNNERH